MPKGGARQGAGRPKKCLLNNHNIIQAKAKAKKGTKNTPGIGDIQREDTIATCSAL